jgi:hypothetical protein
MITPAANLPNPFASARQKLARAETHFAELSRHVINFINDHPYEEVHEPDSDRKGFIVHKVRLTKQLPNEIADSVGDVLGTIRSALDHACFALAVAAGNPDPRNAAFPFGKTVDNMVNALGRCKDVPKEIHPLFCGFQPYKGGDNQLWALNELCNADKHRIVTPIGTGIVRHNASFRATGGYISIPDPHVWDRAKNEMVIVTLGPTTEFKYELQFAIFVAFNEVEYVDGKPVLETLFNIGCKVESILGGIEAEAKRLKIIL